MLEVGMNAIAQGRCPAIFNLKSFEEYRAKRVRCECFFAVRGARRTLCASEIPLHWLPCHADLGFERGDFRASEKAAGKILAFPIFAEHSDQIEWVTLAIRSFRS